ncbi:hypothetical protein J6O48_03535 [bacterium]|nr:hypothetical protein [bacterium]
MSDCNNKLLTPKEILNMILVNAISADNNFDIPSCENSLKTLETVKELISESKARQYITDKELEYYLNKIKEAYVILNNDIERFKNENENNKS